MNRIDVGCWTDAMALVGAALGATALFSLSAYDPSLDFVPVYQIYSMNIITYTMRIYIYNYMYEATTGRASNSTRSRPC